MPRKPRIHYEGALYHVICRGNNREEIFRTDEEKQAYLELIKDYKKRYGFKFYAWVFMSNHAHLLIEVGTASLSKSMKGFSRVTPVGITVSINIVAMYSSSATRRHYAIRKLMSQYRQETKERPRSENDYKINLKSEIEIRTLHEKVDHLLLEQ